MKKQKNELNVDFIGDGRSLTKEEEKIITEFIKTSKGNKNNKVLKIRALPRKKINL